MGTTVYRGSSKPTTSVLCAGQEWDRSHYDEPVALGVHPRVIGGADLAAELDALRAIDQGMRVALAF